MLDALKTELYEVKWFPKLAGMNRANPSRDAKIMAAWEAGQTYSDIARTMRGVSRSVVARVVARNRDDGHVSVPRGPLMGYKRGFLKRGRPRKEEVPFIIEEDETNYGETPIKAFRQPEVDEKIAARARLMGALR